MEDQAEYGLHVGGVVVVVAPRVKPPITTGGNVKLADGCLGTVNPGAKVGIAPGGTVPPGVRVALAGKLPPGAGNTKCGACRNRLGVSRSSVTTAASCLLACVTEHWQSILVPSGMLSSQLYVF